MCQNYPSGRLLDEPRHGPAPCANHSGHSLGRHNFQYFWFGGYTNRSMARVALGQDILVARVTPWRTLRRGHSSCAGSRLFSDHLAESIAASCRRTRVPATIHSDLDRSPAVLESSDPLFQHHLCSGMDLCAFSLVACTTTLALIAVLRPRTVAPLPLNTNEGTQDKGRGAGLPQ